MVVNCASWGPNKISWSRSKDYKAKICETEAEETNIERQKRTRIPWARRHKHQKRFPKKKPTWPTVQLGQAEPFPLLNELAEEYSVQMLTANQHQQQKQGRVVIRTFTLYLINSRSSLDEVQQRWPKWQTSSSKNARGTIHNLVLLYTRAPTFCPTTCGSRGATRGGEATKKRICSAKKRLNKRQKHKTKRTWPAAESCKLSPASRAKEEEIPSEGLHLKKEPGLIKDKSKNYQDKEKRSRSLLDNLLEATCHPREAKIQKWHIEQIILNHLKGRDWDGLRNRSRYNCHRRGTGCRFMTILKKAIQLLWKWAKRQA